MAPSLSLREDRYNVALVGEALGKDEAEEGAPFVGKAGHKLTRLIEWAGLDRARFDIFNTAWCRPPDNKLEGTPYEGPSIAHCRTAHWGSLLSRSRVIVPMGNVPLNAFTGRKGILSVRGYVTGGDGYHIIPTVHPSFIQRGQSKYSAAFIHDIQKAVTLAREGLPFTQLDYTLDPLPGQALDWAKAYRDSGAKYLAYDIETPGKGEDEGDLDTDDDPTYTIFRIGFSYKPNSALSIPWEPAYIPAIRMLLENAGEKVVWNAGFDNPRIRRAGVEIGGCNHDGMVAWHILHSDLPKGLAFVATFTCPYQPAWKHLSHARPAFYNATDADVELRSMLVIEAELKRSDLWGVYERDVLDLDPILQFMSREGMPIDAEVRYDRACQLDEKLRLVKGELEGLVPLAARRYSPKEGYARQPEDTSRLINITVSVPVPRCSTCGLPYPTKPHFKTYKRPTEKRPQNPCAGAGPITTVEFVERFARLDEFKPSREQLIRYQQALNRPVPQTRDKKTGLMKATMDEKALKGLIVKYPLDPLYKYVLEYRELDKLAGTYIGRPGGE